MPGYESSYSLGDSFAPRTSCFDQDDTLFFQTSQLLQGGWLDSAEL